MGMWALRGMPEDYDAWRDAGAVGWGWDDVLPAFRRLENDLISRVRSMAKEAPFQSGVLGEITGPDSSVG